MFAKVLDGPKIRIPKDLRAELPYLLWVYHMGIILFWIHDKSPKHRRTYRLVDHTVDLLDKLIRWRAIRSCDRCENRRCAWLMNCAMRRKPSTTIRVKPRELRGSDENQKSIIST